MITEPGVYFDLPAVDYHKEHDWLSASNLKRLVPPSTPAHFKAALRKGEERKRHFDLGKVVHTLALGVGDVFEVVQSLGRDKQPKDAEDYTTVSAKAHRDLIYAAGKVPILRSELELAEAMAASVAAHPLASRLIDHERGKPEVSLFWVDPATGVKCRARLDWLPDPVKGKRMIVPDLKSAESAETRTFSKAAARWGYLFQHRHYLDGIKALGLDSDPAFVFIAVEKEDPYLVNVGRFSERDDLHLARAVVDKARRIFAACTATDTWPGYPERIADLALPAYTHYDLEDFIAP